MKKSVVLLTVLLTLCLGTSALAELTFDGVVVAGETISVAAPFGGTVESLSIREGSAISAGDEIAVLSTNKVYAPSDGQVTAVFAQPGDDLTRIAADYGAPLYLSPENVYSVEADLRYAYDAAENRMIHLGETVFLSCQTDGGDHTAEGVVTAVSGAGFTVKTTAGQLKVGESVRIYRDSDYSSKARIGGGSVTRVSDIAVTGEGSLLQMHVKAGDSVKRGQLLYETVSGTLDGYAAQNSRITAPFGGIVGGISTQVGESISKGNSLITLYPRDKFQVQINLSEYDLPAAHVGDTITFTLDYQSDFPNASVYSGQIEEISYLGVNENGEVAYAAYISFECDELVRLGMKAVVVIP